MRQIGSIHPSAARARAPMRRSSSGERRLPACSCRQPCRQHLLHAWLPENASTAWSRQAAETCRQAACAPRLQRRGIITAHDDCVQGGSACNYDQNFASDSDIFFALSIATHRLSRSFPRINQSATSSKLPPKRTYTTRNNAIRDCFRPESDKFLQSRELAYLLRSS